MSPRAEAPSAPLDPRLRTAIATVAIVGAALSAAALAFFGPAAALSVTMGGGIAAANLWALARIVAALLPAEPEAAQAQSRGGWALLAALKMFGLVAAVWLLMRHGVVSALPMLVGFGALPIGIAIGSLVSDRSAPREDKAN
jgi:ATP synthase I chain